jgi:hypothetical protein
LRQTCTVQGSSGHCFPYGQLLAGAELTLKSCWCHFLFSSYVSVVADSLGERVRLLFLDHDHLRIITSDEFLGLI